MCPTGTGPGSSMPCAMCPLTMMHRELGDDNRLSENMLTVVRQMAEFTHISVEDLDDSLSQIRLHRPSRLTRPGCPFIRALADC